MGFVDDHGEAFAWQLADLLGNHGELLQSRHSSFTTSKTIPERPRNVADEHADIVEQIAAVLADAREPSANFPFPLDP